jgi:hypothetical protein
MFPLQLLNMLGDLSLSLVVRSHDGVDSSLKIGTAGFCVRESLNNMLEKLTRRGAVGHHYFPV